MTLFSLIAALLLEQVRPLDSRNRVNLLFMRYIDILERQFNAGEKRHGTIAWIAVVVPPVVATAAMYYFLYTFSPFLAWVWNVMVLYFTMGFRQFSHSFTAIAEALRGDDLQTARQLLREWRGERSEHFNTTETARVAIEQGFISSHYYVFGVIFWFVLLPGPVGAVLYRVAAMVSERWGERTDEEFGDFGHFARRIFEIMDWIPARLTAGSFAIVGDFEDAVYCWRSQALSWTHANRGVILASAAGALGVRLGESLQRTDGVEYRPELGVGDEADVDYMQSAVGLVWRSLVLWVLLILLITVVRWFGL